MSRLGLILTVAWIVAMVFWVEAGWGPWVIPAAAAIVVCVWWIVSPRS